MCLCDVSNVCTGAGTIGGTAGWSSAGWAGVRSAADHGRGLGSQAAPQQLVKVQLLLPALEVYLPLLTADAAPCAAADESDSSSIGDRGSIQQNLTGAGSSEGLLRQSNSGGNSSAAAAEARSRSSSNSRGRSSLDGSLVAAAAYSAVEAEGQGGLYNQHVGDGSAAAAETLQNAISRALGVDASQLTYYAMQHMQLSGLLQEQQQQQVSQSAQKHTPAQASISNAGSAADDGSRPPSRGPSLSRGRSASSSKLGQALFLPLPEQQQPWNVVVGFREGSCEFSLARLEEILQCASAAGGDPMLLPESTQQLQVRVHGWNGSLSRITLPMLPCMNNSHGWPVHSTMKGGSYTGPPGGWGTRMQSRSRPGSVPPCHPCLPAFTCPPELLPSTATHT